MIKVIKNIITKSSIRIGVGIPCHERDLYFLSNFSLPTALDLFPAPDVVIVNINRGEGGIKKIRTDLFNVLFDKYGCDVVFHFDADMLVSKDALKFVKKNRVVSFGPIFKRPIATILNLLLRFIITLRKGKGWRGTYSLPKDIWIDMVRNSTLWDGSDSSLRRVINNDFDFVPIPKVLILRRRSLALKQVILFHPNNEGLTTFEKIIRLTQAINC